MDDMIGITAICGDEGTGKTSAGLTWPKPIFHLDIDVGGFDRAAWRLTEQFKVKVLNPGDTINGQDSSAYDIISKSYPRPVNLEKLMGAQATKQGNQVVSVRFPKKVEGMKELWQIIVQDFVRICQLPLIKTIMVDTSTLFWVVDHQTYLQELQEKQLAQGVAEENIREKLQPIEYTTANDRMVQIFHTARSFKKNLVLTHYPRDVYAEQVNAKGEVVEFKTGRQEMDGFNRTAKLADLILWLTVKEDQGVKHPVARILKCGIKGMGMAAVGMDVNADFQSVINLRNLIRASVPNPAMPDNRGKVKVSVPGPAPLSLADQLKALQGGG